MSSAGRLERAAAALLTDVGGDCEWWRWNPRSRIGDLRVPVTTVEYAQVPPGCVVADAGETGVKRRRRRPSRA